MAVDEMLLAQDAWQTAYSAINTACTTLGTVRGAADEYDQLCRLATTFQRKGADLIEIARRKAAKVARAEP